MKRKSIIQKLVAFCAGLVAIVCGTFAVTGVLAEQETPQTPSITEAAGLQYSDMFTTNEYATLNDHVTYKQQTGLQVVMSNRQAKIEYKGVVDLRDNDESSPLFELIFSPQTVGQAEISGLTFTFTDYFNPSNYLIFTIYGLVTQYPNLTCVSAYGNGQSMYSATWVSYPSSIVGTRDYPLAVYFNATTLATKAWPTRWGKNEDRNSLDTIRDLDAGSGTGWLKEGEPAWEGLKSGLYNLTITASGVSSTSASFLLLGLDGLTFSGEEVMATDERVSIGIDYNSYDKEELPYGVVGLGYSVQEAKVISNFGGTLGNVPPVVIDNDGNTLPVINGKFYPQKAGTHFVLYGMTTDLGTVGARRYRVDVKSTYEQDISYTANGNLVSEASVGDTVFVYEGVPSGGSGLLDVKNEVLFNGQAVETQNEGYCDFFVPTQAGEYVVKTVIKDYLETSKTFEHVITVTENMEKLRVEFVPKAAMKGQTFTLPKGYYEGTNGAQAVTVKLNGQDYTAETYVPQETFTLTYAQGGETETYTVQVQDGAYTEGFMANYFYAENGNVGFDNDDAMELNALSGNSSFTFARALHREVIGFSFKFVENADDFTSIEFCLQDGLDASKTVVFSIVREKQQDGSVKFFAVTNGGLDKKELTDNLFANVYAVSFDCEKNAFVSTDGTVLGAVRFYENMREYQGLSENVYVSVKVNGVEESAKFKFISLSNQQLMNYEEDFTLPQFVWAQEFVSLEQKQLNEQYTTRKVFGYDVLDDSLESEVTVRYNGKVVYGGNGNEPYTFTLSAYGTYTVVYVLLDGNYNAMRATVTIAVLDNVNPEVSLSGKFDTSAEVGETVRLADVSVGDNVSSSDKIKIYYIVRDLETGKEVVLSKNEYETKQEGNYTVRVLAVDEAGNVSSVEYVLEVK